MAMSGFLYNSWYVAAWDHEVVTGQLLSRKILGQNICFYRSEEGKVVALEDRCCHRWAPLSLGRQEGNAIRCMYHGLKFDPQGACIEIPGQAQIPDKARVRSYPVVQSKRWVWIWMGDADKADPTLIPDTFSLESPEWRMKPGYMHYQANYLYIIDNLLDFSHLTFVHPDTLGGTEALAGQRPAIRRMERGVNVERWVLDDQPAPFHKKVGQFPGDVDRWYIYDFWVPGVLLMDSGVQAARTGAREGKRHDALEFRSCQALTPETETTTHYFWAVPHNFALDDASVTDSIYQSVVTAFEEDRRMIEAQQRIVDTAPEGDMVAIVADAALMQFRSILQRMMHDERTKGGMHDMAT